MEKITMRKLYRDKRRGMIAGVAAGLAHYLDLNIGVVRFLLVICLFTFPPTFFVYFTLAILLKKMPKKQRKASGLEFSLEESVKMQFEETMKVFNQVQQDTAQRLDKCEQRVVKLEAFVTSDEFEFQRKIWDLKS